MRIFPPRPTDHRPHDVKPQARPRLLALQLRAQSHEAAKNQVPQRMRNAAPVVAHRTTTWLAPSDSQGISTSGCCSSAYFRPLSIRLRKISSKIDRRCADNRRRQVEPDRLRRPLIRLTRRLGRRRNDLVQPHVFGLRADAVFFQPGHVEQMIDELVEPLDILQHVLEERLLLGRRANASPIERLQIELQRRNRAFQLVRHRIDEVRLPPAEIDGLDRERQIQGRADDRESQKRRRRSTTGRYTAPACLAVAEEAQDELRTIQPTSSAASTTNISTPSVIGQRRERCSNIEVADGSARD